MRFILSTLAVLAALTLIAVSGSMNFLFMRNMGANPDEGMVLGAASVAVDIFKALLPVLMWWAWSAKRYIFIIPAGFMFILFAGFSFASAVGFAASTRGHVSELREGANAELAAVVSDLKHQRGKLAALPKHRPAPVVEQAINAVKQSARWTSTKECTNATAGRSRAFCAGYFSLKGELEAAITASRIERRIAALNKEEKALRSRGAGGDKDPQVSILAKLTQNNEGDVRMALILFIAGLLELGSGLGLWIATGHSEIFRRKEPKHQIIEPVPMQPVDPPPAPSTAPQITHEPANDHDRATPIMDYLIARLQPSETGGLTISEMYRDYQTWCRAGGSKPEPKAFFETVIHTAMAELDGITFNGRQFTPLQFADNPALTA